jgi:uncharacterized protein
VAVVTQSLSAAEARRIFLDAQGLASKRRARRPREQDFATYVERQGVLQLDTVNVLARAHYLPFFSRLGPYDVAALDTYLWGAHDGHGTHTFEHWGHEASVMPDDLLPAMHHRMVSDGNWMSRTRDRLEAERPGLIAQVRAFVNDRGPVTSTEVEHLSPRETKRGTWWDTSHVKDALDLLFITGQIASSRGKSFARTYDATDRAWGLPPVGTADAGTDSPGDRPWGLSADAGRQELFDRALAACGIGTPADLCDHFRLPLKPGKNAPNAAGGQAWAASAVERGLAQWVSVEGWSEPALLATGGPTPEAPWHRAASDPGRATGAALLSPFDPVCWYRPRLDRMFGMEYRIEIYTPAPKRLYGYYCLPFLLGDQIVGRVDLKADRKARVLRVAAAWREDHAAAGARRRTDTEVAVALSSELALMREWLSLDAIDVTPRGNLAPALTQACAQAQDLR